MFSGNRSALEDSASPGTAASRKNVAVAMINSVNNIVINLLIVYFIIMPPNPSAGICPK